MSSIEKSIDVNVPVSVAYNQWTQFEDFPHFMEGIEQVQQLDKKRLHWRAEIGGKAKEWDAEIVEQTPDKRVAWRSLSGAPNDGIVTFQPIGNNSTRVRLALDYEPEGFLENVGDALGFVSGRVEGDLKRFKEFIESRGTETGAWRGQIHDQAAGGTTSGASTRQTASASGAAGAAKTTKRAAAGNQGEAVLPVIEEQINIGKQQVQTGGVHVHTNVEERPVEENVNLREERVNVERRPANRPVSDADVNAFKEQSFEVTEMSEQPVVRKQARVIEEVVVRKDVRERTETVRDTVRRQDVQVDKADTIERSVGATGYDAYDADFRQHFGKNYANSGYTYEQYSPVYRYGYSLANDNRFAGKDWNTFEPDARREWESHNPGTWNEFKDSVRYAWDRARGRR